MKTLRLALLLILPLLLSARADEARFFRIASPVTSTITAFSADGFVTWTNAPTNTSFTIQMATSLSGASNWVDFVRIPTASGVNTNRLFDPAGPPGMTLIPAGSFTMGDNLNSDPLALPLHTVYVSAFYMDRYEVTKALWDEVYLWATNNGYSFSAGSGLGKASNHPVHTVNWYDVVKWCNARSEKEGRTPAYYTNAAQMVVYRSGQVNVHNSWVNWSAGYRLPTESEWEKAARGGASGHRFPWSNVDTISHSQANYYAGSSYPYNLSYPTTYHPPFATGGFPYTSPVGGFAPNGYGLYDMAGNVFEWCWDWYADYSSASQTNPRGSTSGQYGSYRVGRGGSWGNDAFACRAAYRDYGGIQPSGWDVRIGFRSVLPTGQ